MYQVMQTNKQTKKQKKKNRTNQTKAPHLMKEKIPHTGDKASLDRYQKNPASKAKFAKN